MDFNLTEPEKMLQAAAREFALREVQPRAAAIDRSNQFPTDLASELGRRGYQGLAYQAEYGGSGAGYLAYALVLEQISQASTTLAAVMAVSAVVKEAIFRFGTEAQKRAFLSPLARGEWLACIAFTEAETGSDPDAIQTPSRKTASGYIIDGEKQFVACAPAARLALVFARSPSKGLNAFIVDTTSPGFRVGELYDTMGLRGLGTAPVYMDGVAVPKENRLGAEGGGFEVLLEAISLGRLGVAVESVGVAQAALDLSLEYAEQRKVRGKPLSRLPSTQWLLAEMASRVEAGRWLAYHTAWLRDQGFSIRQESSLAKLHCSQMSVEVTRMAMQVHGSYGTVRGMPVERLYRDAKMAEIYVGISEIQRGIIGGGLVSRGA
ncbi:MAG: acyl-CoA dehydrogenase family protein [Chloroflexi bacterium]|nr:acyl-CoA dehydrogenase family protein [Chloroflexota bacterium]